MAGAGQPALSFDAALRGAGLSFERWWRQRIQAGRLYGPLVPASPEVLSPALVRETLAAADKVLQHRFCLLGSDEFCPRRPDCPAPAGSYQPIDWVLDPVSGLRFPEGIPHKEWNLYAMRPGLADIKLPWELARCQHWVTLGQAYWLSGDEKYAQEMQNQCDDFREANPVGRGILWTCTMDVALRAANWALGLELIHDSATARASFWKRTYGALFDHGVFIFANLENHYEVTSNHFLSNVVGLYYLAAIFRDFAQGRQWADFCRTALAQEMEIQVLEDGADFESSVPYHRLVAELFLGALRLSDAQGEPLSDHYRRRVGHMVEHLVGVMRPDGLMPQVGDADDGRLHIFSGYGRWRPQDGRHLLGPAALILHEPAWLAHTGEDGLWEAAWWGLDVARVCVRSEPPPAIRRLYPQAGIAVARDAATYLLITNGIVGTKGFGNHKHNDLLGFEFHAQGIPLLVDPGSYVYTSDPDARNLFRSTAYHNTLCIDGVEQNEVKPEWLFRTFETARPEHVFFAADGGVVTYCGRHHGYERLAAPIVHERTFRLDPRSGEVTITDRLRGTGKHLLSWHFHCAPGVAVTAPSATTRLLHAGALCYCLSVPADLTGDVKPAWYSPSYGVRVPCQAIDLRADVELPGEIAWTFTLAPFPGRS